MSQFEKNIVTKRNKDTKRARSGRDGVEGLSGSKEQRLQTVAQ
jgi:hypothetical protein